MDEKFKVDDVIVKPVEEPAKTETPVEKTDPSQEQLDWRRGLSEDLRTKENFLKFKTVSDLANSYSELEKKLGGGGLNNINKDTSHEEIISSMTKVLNLKKESFKDINPELQDIGLKNGIHPNTFKNIVDEIEGVYKSKEDIKQQSYQKSLVGISEEEERNINAGLDYLGMSYKEYKNIFKGESLNPDVLNKIKDLGSKHRDDGITKIKEGNSTGGLPSSSEELNALFEMKSREILLLRDKGDFVAADKIRQDLGKIKAKYQKSRIDEARAKTTLY